jgi:hypothetical protein
MRLVFIVLVIGAHTARSEMKPSVLYVPTQTKALQIALHFVIVLFV